MRILYTHRTQGVGAEGAHILGMFEAFKELGHEVEMHCLPGCNPADRKAASTQKGGSVSENFLKTIFKKLYGFVAEHCPESVFEWVELAYNVPLFFELARIHLRFRPQMIYERYALNTFAPSLLTRMTQCRHILEVNDSVVIERSRALTFYRIAAFWEGFCLRSSDLAVTITGHFKAKLAAKFPSQAGKILVLANAISGRRFDKAFDKAAARAKLGLKDQTVIGASGQFLPWHGLAELIDALGPIAEARNIFFLFIGDGPVREDILRKAAALGIADRVKFTGMVPITSMTDYLAAVDIAVIPTVAAHASPMKLMEYMGMGLPIVAPDLDCIRAAVDEDTAAIFAAGDFLKMREKIVELLDAPETAARIGRRAKEHVLAELTWTRHAEKVLAGGMGVSSKAGAGK